MGIIVRPEFNRSLPPPHPNFGGGFRLNPHSKLNYGLVACYLLNERAGSICRNLCDPKSPFTLSYGSLGPYGFTGAVDVTNAKAPSTDLLCSPSTMLTVAVLVNLPSNVGTASYPCLLGKYYASGEPYWTWVMQQSGTTDRRIYANVTVSGTRRETLPYTISADTDYWIFLRWKTGRSITLYFYLANNASYVTNVSVGPYSGTLTYNTQPLRMLDGMAGTIKHVSVYNRFIENHELNDYIIHPYGTPESPRFISYGRPYGPSAWGTVCWGHDTGVTEVNIRDFQGNWSGDGYIAGAGDAEKLFFDTGEYMESETWNIGARRIKIQVDKYAIGSGSRSIQYKNGSTQALCEADAWHNYVSSFVCSGWVKVRVNAT